MYGCARARVCVCVCVCVESYKQGILENTLFFQSRILFKLVLNLHEVVFNFW